MQIIASVLLFVFGAAVGSYLNVLALRYSPDSGFRLAQKGRSHCPHCSHELGAHELIPIFSFVFQRGRCRKCGSKISWQYPVVEILAGLTLALIPLTLGFTFPALIWTLAFLTFILIALIDLRLRLIPDKLNLFIALLGLALIFFYYFTDTFGFADGTINGSFVGSYALVFRLFGGNIFANFAAGTVFGALFFGLVYFLSRGRAMGFGDVKLAAAVGLLMGWPDSVLSFVLSFIVGAIIGIFLLVSRKKDMKSTIPFGPFIVLGVTLVFFFGYDIVNGYFAAFSLW